MTPNMHLIAYAELYAIDYQQKGLPFEALKADLVAEAMIMPHFNTVDRYMAMQAAANFADTLVAPAWRQLTIDRARYAAQTALDFIARSGRNDN